MGSPVLLIKDDMSLVVDTSTANDKSVLGFKRIFTGKPTDLSHKISAMMLPNAPLKYKIK